ncbi:hypothetical protein SIL80_09715 [Bacillus cereus group sp. BfR-BA-01119]|uniref:hypothetical protein n=1 Tax=unclassified Bacillus cereus group TaxID=2750818 RepID=UPI0029C212C3|nr:MULTISPECIES: hypothetical protein [unclassified Bacillus cereus group]MDX5866165.1 hypothetical protein [Bacillus cereus group sp. BfR-BA-01119]MDX5907891.1 hypothetical protein [Bacillus cereus group sp. BfR-BA-01029]
MFSQAMLRNITKTRLKNYLQPKEIPNLNRRTHAHFVSDYSGILEVFREEIAIGKKLNENDVDNFIYNELFYENCNYYYIYKLDKIKIDLNLAEPNMIQYLTTIGFNINQLLTQGNVASDYDLCTTRLNFKDSKLSRINCLLKVSSVDSEYRGETDFYCGIMLDLTNNLLILKFNLNLLESHPKEKLAILTDIRKIITNSKPFNQLNLKYSSYNEHTIRKIIFRMFKNLSLDAETILNQRIPTDATQKIKKFLQDMKVAEVSENYINQTKAVVYQDISKTFQDSLFTNGWVFRFVFREGDSTRASSRTDDFSPIYSKQVYWHLKELVFKSGELQEAGFHWYLNPAKKEGIILIKLEQKNDALAFQFYQNTDLNRVVKEDYVINEIAKQLP